MKQAVRSIPIAADGALTGLRVVGFHGHVDPAHSPARREAILIDEERHLVRIEHVDMGADSTTPAGVVHLRLGDRMEEGQSLPGSATPLGPYPAFLGNQVVVVGPTELSMVEQLRDAANQPDGDHVASFLDWLRKPQAPEHPNAQQLGSGFAWYCELSKAQSLFERIRQVATKEVVRAAILRDSRRLSSSSWWLSRAALDDADIYLAAVGLERSGDAGMADTLLRATLRKRPREQLEAGLDHARRRFEALSSNQNDGLGAHLDTRRGEDIGSLAKSRNIVRQYSLIARRAA